MVDASTTRVHVDLPNHWATSGETFHADSLGDGIYRLQNVPFFAYGLNFLDVVAAAPDANGIRVIQRVVTASGRRTLRVKFAGSLERKRQEQLLGALCNDAVSYERATGALIAFDIKSKSAFDALFKQLESLSDQGLLDFETCEARVEGSFDAEADDA